MNGGVDTRGRQPRTMKSNFQAHSMQPTIATGAAAGSQNPYAGSSVTGTKLRATSPASAALKLRSARATTPTGTSKAAPTSTSRSVSGEQQEGNGAAGEPSLRSTTELRGRVQSSGYGRNGSYSPRVNISPSRVTNFVTEIPDHLKHKPVSAATPFGYVNSKWQEPKTKINVEHYYQSHAPRKEHIPQNPQFGGVVARYRSPSPDKKKGVEEQVLPKTESVKMTPQYAQHKRHAALVGMGGVNSKYVESAQRASSPTVTPREVVEQNLAKIHKDVNKNSGNKPFSTRSTPVRCFDDHRKYNQQLSRWESPTKKSSQRPSIVMQYISGDVTLGPEPRQPSPSAEPRLDNQIYVGGGGTIKSKSPVRKAGQLENGKISELRDRLKAAKATQHKKADLERIATPKVINPKVIPMAGPPRPVSPRGRAAAATAVVTKKGTSKPKSEQAKESEPALKTSDEEQPVVVNFDDDGQEVPQQSEERAEDGGDDGEEYRRHESQQSAEGRTEVRGMTKAPLLFKQTEPPRL